MQQLLQHSAGVSEGTSSESPAVYAGPVMGAAIVPEGHRQSAKVPNDRAQRPKPLDTKHQVEAAQVQREAVNGEGLATDDDQGSEADTRATHPVTVSHHDVEASTRGDGETQALRKRGVNERVGGAGIHQCTQLYTTYCHLQQQSQRS